MKKYSIYLWMMLLMAACGGGDDDGDEPVVSKDYIRVATSVTLLPDGNVAELDITANCNWTIMVSENWLAVTPLSGNNNGTVRVSAGKNSTGADRTAMLTIQGGSAPTQYVMVTQGKSSDSQDPTTTGEPGANDNQPPT